MLLHNTACNATCPPKYGHGQTFCLAIAGLSFSADLFKSTAHKRIHGIWWLWCHISNHRNPIAVYNVLYNVTTLKSLDYNVVMTFRFNNNNNNNNKTLQHINLSWFISLAVYFALTTTGEFIWFSTRVQSYNITIIYHYHHHHCANLYNACILCSAGLTIVPVWTPLRELTAFPQIP